MEDHSQAYFAWKQAGVREAWCWHVDAHLDIGRDGLDEAALKQLQPALNPLPELTGNAYVPWGGLNCGNYLYPAIRHGLVGRLTWVIPPDLPHKGKLLDWARLHLNGWLDLTIEESTGLRDAGGYVEGNLLGIPFQLGTAAALPHPTEPVLLDVDLDYYLDLQGQVWQEPPGPLPSSHLTTVAFSVLGGYTPPEQRCLAAPWTDDWNGYQGNALDEAARCLRLRHYEPGLERLGDLKTVEAEYLRGTCQHHSGQFEAALQTWHRLRPQLPSLGQAYLDGLVSELLSTRLKQPKAALEAAQQGLHIVEDYRLYFAAAVALEQLDQPRQASQMLRRGLRLAEGTVISLKMRQLLARLYRKQGKEGLAQVELAYLKSAERV